MLWGVNCTHGGGNVVELKKNLVVIMPGISIPNRGWKKMKSVDILQKIATIRIMASSSTGLDAARKPK